MNANQIEIASCKRLIKAQLEKAIMTMQSALNEATSSMKHEYSLGSIDVLNKISWGFANASSSIGNAIHFERELAALEQKESK